MCLILLPVTKRVKKWLSVKLPGVAGKTPHGYYNPLFISA